MSERFSEFSARDAVSIRNELVDLRLSNRTDQKALRATLRTTYGFHVSDFSKSNHGFTAHDFDRIIASGEITIESITTDSKRAYAMSVVIESELAAGRDPQVLPSVAQERINGCDLLAHNRETGTVDRVEVKGWGSAFLSKSGKFTFDQELRASQVAAAKSDKGFRVEIVANLDNFMRGMATYERLTLTSAEIREPERLKPQIYWISLDGLQSKIRQPDL